MSHCLCEDLITEIFERLPVKFLLRFRSLSKSWCSRIDSPAFIHMYYLRSMKTSSRRKVLIRQTNYRDVDGINDLYALHSLDQFALCHGHGYINISTLKFPCNKPRVINSCNGILCLVDYKRRRIILWNPSIRRKLTLPDHPYSDDVERPFMAVGLGLDPISNDYKIVSIFFLKYKGNAKNSFVYSLKTHSWFPIASPATPFDDISSTACFVNGVLHWVAYSYIPRSLDHYIMTFNLSTHVFGKIRLPEPSWVTRKPTIINGCLAVISYQSDYNCWIWVMQEYNNAASWSVLFKVQSLSSDDDGDLKKVLQLTTNGYFLINTYLAGIKVYNIATGVHFALFEQIYHDVNMEMCLDVNMEMCLESLELLDKGEVEL